MPSVPRGFSGSAGAKFGFQVKNTNKVVAALAAYGNKKRMLVNVAVKKALIIVEAEAIRLVRGNVYWKNPIDTRRMSNTITNKLVKFTFTAIEGKVGTNVQYAVYVHEGTKLMAIGAENSGNTAEDLGKRPFLIDALKNKRKEIVDLIIDAYKKELYQWI